MWLIYTASLQRKPHQKATTSHTIKINLYSSTHVIYVKDVYILFGKGLVYEAISQLQIEKWSQILKIQVFKY